MGGEESSTSMVFDDRVELLVDAVFRGLFLLLSVLAGFPKAAEMFIFCCRLLLRKKKIFQHKM